MNKNSGIRLILVAILCMVFFVPIYPTVQWVRMDKTSKEKAELKYEDPEAYKLLPLDEQSKVDLLKAVKDKTINLGLDLQGGMHIVLEADITNFKSLKERQDAISQALEIIRNRVDQFGVSEPSIVKEGENRIVVELPGVKDPQRAEELLNVQGKLEFKIVDDDLSKKDNFKDYEKGILKDDVQLPDDKEILFVWEKNPQTKNWSKNIQ